MHQPNGPPVEPLLLNVMDGKRGTDSKCVRAYEAPFLLLSIYHKNNITGKNLFI